MMKMMITTRTMMRMIVEHLDVMKMTKKKMMIRKKIDVEDDVKMKMKLQTLMYNNKLILGNVNVLTEILLRLLLRLLV